MNHSHRLMIPCALVAGMLLLLTGGRKPSPPTAPAEPPASTAQAWEETNITFLAPLDGTARPLYARGDAKPIYSDSLEWVKGRRPGTRALRMRRSREVELGKEKGRGSGLIFSATGHLYGEAGTLSYWVKPEWDADDPSIGNGPVQNGPHLLNVSSWENAYYHLFLRCHLQGTNFRLALYDRHGKWKGTNYSEGIRTWKKGQWHHLVFTWDRHSGLAIYDNGRQIASSSVPFEPLTPARFAFSAIAGVSGRHQIARYGADTVYSDVVMLDRRVTTDEVPLLAEGRYTALPVRVPGEASAPPTAEELAALHLSPDPHRIRLKRGDDGRFSAVVTQHYIEEIESRFIRNGELSDGLFHPQVHYHQGGLDFDRTLTFRLGDSGVPDHLYLAGEPPPEKAFRVGNASLSRHERTPADLHRLPLEELPSLAVPGGSHLGEVLFYSVETPSAATHPPSSETLSLAATPKALGPRRELLIRHFQARDHALLIPGDTPFSPLKAAAGQRLHLATSPMRETAALTAIHLQMTVTADATPLTLRLRAFNPFDPEAHDLYLDFDLPVTPGTPETLELTLKARGLFAPKGERLVLEAVANHGYTLAKAPVLSYNTAPVAQEARPFAEHALRRINEEFTLQMSQNFSSLVRKIETENELTLGLERILHYDPTNPLALDLQHWVRMKPWPQLKEPLPGPESFPRAVRLAHGAALQAAKIIHWWIDRRQDETGFMVGRAEPWNDETKLFTEFSFLTLLLGDEKLTAGMERHLDSHWHSSQMNKGWTSRLTDIVHSAEEANYLQPTMALLRYGDPIHLERLMETAANVETWTGRTREGHRLFRSNYYTADTVRIEGKRGYDVPLNTTALLPTLYLAWYSRHPVAVAHLVEWADGWLHAINTETKEKAAGLIPAGIHFKTGRPTADRKHYPAQITMFLAAAWHLTGDSKYLQPMLGYLERRDPDWTSYLGMAAPEIRQHLGATDFDPLFLAKADEGNRNVDADQFFQRGIIHGELPQLLSWQATGDLVYLEKIALRAWRNNHRAQRIYTIVDPHKDRVYPWGRYFLTWMYLGGNGFTERGNGPWPTLAFSWEQTDAEVASVVHRHQPDQLELSAYNFGPERTAQMRLWSLQPGTYRVQIGDKDATEVSLMRGELLPVTLPAEKETKITLQRTKRGDWSPQRADLALSHGADKDISDGLLRFTVHNVGSQDAPASKAHLLQGKRVVATTDIPPIPAPLDFKPRRVEATFAVTPETVAGTFQVVLDPEGELSEITRENNLLEIAFP